MENKPLPDGECDNTASHSLWHQILRHVCISVGLVYSLASSGWGWGASWRSDNLAELVHGNHCLNTGDIEQFSTGVHAMVETTGDGCG